MIRLENITFAYGRQADAFAPNGAGQPILAGINLQIRAGVHLAVAGGNGSGKSTLAKIVAGLLRPTTGTIFVDELPVTRQNVAHTLHTMVGYIFANPNQQFLGERVVDDLAFGLETHQVPQPEMDGRIQATAEALGIAHLLQRTPQELSGGERQRVAMAGILLLQPKVLILDEATAMLDPAGRSEVRKVMHQFHQRGGTVIEITHDLDDLLEAQEVVWLDHGQIVFQGTPEELIHLPPEWPVPFYLQFGRLLHQAGLISEEAVGIQLPALCRALQQEGD